MPGMSYADSARAAYSAGRTAQPGGDVNPYAGRSLAFAKLWLRGYQTMLLERFYSTPMMQAYLAARQQV